MKVWSTLIFALLIVMSLQVKAEKLPYVSEDEVIAFHLAKDLTGWVKSKPCDACKEQMHKITEETFAKLDNKTVSLKQFVLSKNKPNHLVFSGETNNLVGMIWFSEK